MAYYFEYIMTHYTNYCNYQYSDTIQDIELAAAFFRSMNLNRKDITFL